MSNKDSLWIHAHGSISEKNLCRVQITSQQNSLKTSNNSQVSYHIQMTNLQTQLILTSQICFCVAKCNSTVMVIKKTTILTTILNEKVENNFERKSGFVRWFVLFWLQQKVVSYTKDNIQIEIMKILIRRSRDSLEKRQTAPRLKTTELDLQLHSVHCRQRFFNLQNSQCSMNKSNVSTNFLELQGKKQPLTSKFLLSGIKLSVHVGFRSATEAESAYGVAYVDWLTKKDNLFERVQNQKGTACFVLWGAIVPWINDFCWPWPYH